MNDLLGGVLGGAVAGRDLEVRVFSWQGMMHDTSYMRHIAEQQQAAQWQLGDMQRAFARLTATQHMRNGAPSPPKDGLADFVDFSGTYWGAWTRLTQWLLRWLRPIRCTEQVIDLGRVARGTGQ